MGLNTNTFAQFEDLVEEQIGSSAFAGHSDYLIDGQEHVFVQYYSGDLTLDQAMKEYEYLVTNEIISEDMLMMHYELMIYSNDHKSGHLIKFDFHKTIVGLIRTHITVKMFQPHPNGVVA